MYDNSLSTIELAQRERERTLRERIIEDLMGDGQKYPRYASLEPEPLTHERFTEIENELQAKYGNPKDGHLINY